eukprot:scaffold9523_cov103-Cylindrotheca_fusiformis.AAC.17
MGYVPHPEIPLGGVRPYDIVLLLVLGAMWEVILRLVLLRYKGKPTKLIQQELDLKTLQKQVTISRNKGPSAFVETSKLERQLLADEKSLAEINERRKIRLSAMEQRTKIATYIVSAIIFLLWYGIPIVEFTGRRILSSERVLSVKEGDDMAETAFKAFLFPISFVGVGLKVSKWGLAKPQASSGALLAFWSAQTTAAVLMDAVDALLLV